MLKGKKIAAILCCIAASSIAVQALGATTSVSYDPSLGTLPQAQGWTFNSGSGNPAPQVSGGVLRETVTNGGQYWYKVISGLDFSQSQPFVLTASLNIVSSNFLTNQGSGSSRAGYYFCAMDQSSRSFDFSFAGNGWVAVQYLNSLVPFNFLDGAYHSITVQIQSGRASLSIDGSVVKSGITPSPSIGNCGQPGWVFFGGAASVSKSVTNLKSLSASVSSLPSQSITFPSISAVSLPNPGITLTPTASSGLPVALASTSPAVCTVAGSKVSFSGSGTCTLVATQSGNANYAAANPVAQSFAVNRSNQTVLFTALSGAQVSLTPVPLHAVSSAALPVTFSSSTSTVCTIGVAGLTFISVGVCSLTASQAGNASYLPASSIQTVKVTPGNQTITFSAPKSTNYPHLPFALTASATSGLTVAFSSTTPTICKVAGATVSLYAVGKCTITATQTGNANFNAAPPISQTISITQGPQAYCQPAAWNAPYGGPGGLYDPTEQHCDSGIIIPNGDQYCRPGAYNAPIQGPGGIYDPSKASCNSGIIVPNGELYCPAGAYNAPVQGPGGIYDPTKASCSSGIIIPNGEQYCPAGAWNAPYQGPGGLYDPTKASCSNGIIIPNGEQYCRPGAYNAPYQGPGGLYDPSKASCSNGIIIPNGFQFCVPGNPLRSPWGPGGLYDPNKQNCNSGIITGNP